MVLLCEPDTVTAESAESISEDSSGQIWLTTEGGGFCRFDQEKRVFHTYTTADGLPGDIVYRIIEDDAAGVFWISTSKGLVSFNPHKGKVLRVYTAPVSRTVKGISFSGVWKDSSLSILGNWPAKRGWKILPCISPISRFRTERWL